MARSILSQHVRLWSVVCWVIFSVLASAVKLVNASGSHGWIDRKIVDDGNIHGTEYIISFHQYIPFSEHFEFATKILEETFPPHASTSTPICECHVMNRTLSYSDYASRTDFALISIKNNNSSLLDCLSQLHSHPDIRRIWPQKQVKLAPLWNFDEIDSNQPINPPVRSVLWSNTPNQQTGHWTKMAPKAASSSSQPLSLPEKLNAPALWSMGVKGNGIRVAIFDTGIRNDPSHFDDTTIAECINYTSEPDCNDHLGHGTFVAGVISGKSEQCPGISPSSVLSIYKVFTAKQISFTSWFLDAFNHALSSSVDVINLSIGGPDYTDAPFVDKVQELIKKGIVVVAAAGNDGPLYGTINSPADLSSVIAVGGVSLVASEDQESPQFDVAPFSSRGMTTNELRRPYGYGRIKPDILTYSVGVRGPKVILDNDSGTSGGMCRSLSGTSVAAPIVTGSISLLLSGLKSLDSVVNPSAIKQSLMQTAIRLENRNMFEQGSGILNNDLSAVLAHLQSPPTSATLFAIPSSLDLTSCPYTWPYCQQPLYYTSQPYIINMTVLSTSFSSSASSPWLKFTPKENGHLLSVSFDQLNALDSFGIQIQVNKAGELFSGVARGLITINDELEVDVSIDVIPIPPKRTRILWDVSHSIVYPPHYVPRDNLGSSDNDYSMDWNGDHPHTNFKDLFNYLTAERHFHVEVLNSALHCIDLSLYGTLLLMDTEAHFSDEEVEVIQNAVQEDGLSVVVLAEWHSPLLDPKLRFFDDNTQQWWDPIVGGSNVPSLNKLLQPFGISFGATVYTGSFSCGRFSTAYGSGTSIRTFPVGGLMASSSLIDQTHHLLDSQPEEEGSSGSKPKYRSRSVPVLGFFDTNAEVEEKEQASQAKGKAGRIVVYGDTNCMDSAFTDSLCYWLIDSVFSFASDGSMSKDVETCLSEVPERSNHGLNDGFFDPDVAEAMDAADFEQEKDLLWKKEYIAESSACVEIAHEQPENEFNGKKEQHGQEREGDEELRSSTNTIPMNEFGSQEMDASDMSSLQAMEMVYFSAAVMFLLMGVMILFLRNLKKRRRLLNNGSAQASRPFSPSTQNAAGLRPTGLGMPPSFSFNETGPRSPNNKMLNRNVNAVNYGQQNAYGQA